jgi:hypothetical protein
MNACPPEMPSMCGTVRRSPKFAPEANSMTLFGPGVMEEAKAKRMKRCEDVEGHGRNSDRPHAA